MSVSKSHALRRGARVEISSRNGGVRALCGTSRRRSVWIVAERHGDNIAGFDFFCRFHGFAVYLYASAGAGFRRDGAPFYDARNFEKFVYPHVFTFYSGASSARTGGARKKSRNSPFFFCKRLTDLQNADIIGKCAIMLIPALEIPYFGGRGLYLTALV